MEDIICTEYDPVFAVHCNHKHNSASDKTHYHTEGLTTYRWVVGGPAVEEKPSWMQPENAGLYFDPAVVEAWMAAHGVPAQTNVVDEPVSV